jgi:hypothetical protein
LAKRILAALLVVAAALPLSGCGRKAAPRPVEGGEYPHVYPNITFPNGPGANAPGVTARPSQPDADAAADAPGTGGTVTDYDQQQEFRFRRPAIRVIPPEPPIRMHAAPRGQDTESQQDQ